MLGLSGTPFEIAWSGFWILAIIWVAFRQWRDRNSCTTEGLVFRKFQLVPPAGISNLQLENFLYELGAHAVACPTVSTSVWTAAQ